MSSFKRGMKSETGGKKQEVIKFIQVYCLKNMKIYDLHLNHLVLFLLFFALFGFHSSHAQAVSQEGQQDVTQHFIEAVQQVRTLAAQQRMEEAIALAESQRELMLAVWPEAYHRILIPLYAVTGQYESCFENMQAVREIQQRENPRQRYRYLLLEDAALTAMVESDTASCNLSEADVWL